MRKFDSGIWQKSITGGCFCAPLVTLGRSGRKGSRVAAAAWLALNASRADCHSPDQQVPLDDLEALHVHVFLAAPLGARHMAKSRADQHQGGVPIRKCHHHAGSAADLAVQTLERGVGTSARRENRSRSAFPRCRPRPFWRPPSASSRSSATTAFAFSREAFLLSCAWIALSIFATIPTLDFGTTEKTLR